MDREVLEVRVGVRRRRLAGDIELVVDVAEHRVAEVGRGLDHLQRFRHRHRHVAEELAADRICDDRSLVADDGLCDARGERVRASRPEHPARGDDDRDAGIPGGGDGGARPRAKLYVLGDQRAVEIARERLDARREVCGQGKRQLPAAVETYAATSAICCSVSTPSNGGITPLPFVARSTTRASSGCASSRFGPTVPDVPASESVWQPPQLVVKTTLPATGSPVRPASSRSSSSPSSRSPSSRSRSSRSRSSSSLSGRCPRRSPVRRSSAPRTRRPQVRPRVR